MGTARSCVPFYAPLIEKAGSSTIGALLRRRGGVGGYCRCGPSSLTQLEAARRLMASPPQADCCLAGSHRATRGRAYRFAFVRDPVERFLSGALPKRTTLCRGGPCEADLRRLRDHAHSLAHNFTVRLSAPPHSIHWRTQAYFLSATDARGVPTSWDFIGKLESFEEDWRAVARVLDNATDSSAKVADAGAVKLNAGHDAQTRAAFRERLLREPMLCDVCSVYAQDFACFGYDLPAPCKPSGSCWSAAARTPAEPAPVPFWRRIFGR